MSDRFSDPQQAREALSALADGEARGDEVARACAAWQRDPQARAAWHSYHLIGDVMRSEELARETASAAFLQKLQARLVEEPVVLAPRQASTAAQRAPVVQPEQVPLRRRAWAGPAAVAAGFVLVVGALVNIQLPQQTGSGMPVAQVPVGTRVLAGVEGGQALTARNGGVSLVSVNEPALAEAAAPGQGTEATFNHPSAGTAVLIHDPRLDQLMGIRRTPSPGEQPFAAQQSLIRQVSFEAP